MEKNSCSHCGNEVDIDIPSCPKCHAPMQDDSDDRATNNARKFKFYFVALVIFCFAVMFIAPRVIP